MIRVLSCGCGVQSSTVLLMSIHGELPKLDAAIFADTGDEPMEVYEWAEFLRVKAREAGIEWIDAKASGVRATRGGGSLAGHIIEALKRNHRADSTPVFVRGKDGKASITGRSCTSQWKIKPIEQALRKLIGLRKGQRWPKELAVETWLGISSDEMQRMKCSTRPAQRFWHPLIEAEWVDGESHAKIRQPMIRRSDCLRWMRDHGYPEPPRSACWHCPFKSNTEWRRLRDNDEESWNRAIEFDRALREHDRKFTSSGMVVKEKMYLHRSLVPLDEADLGTDFRPLFDIECAGVCGV